MSSCAGAVYLIVVGRHSVFLESCETSVQKVGRGERSGAGRSFVAAFYTLDAQ
jgi:hypothetical protein